MSKIDRIDKWKYIEYFSERTISFQACLVINESVSKKESTRNSTDSHYYSITQVTICIETK